MNYFKPLALTAISLLAVAAPAQADKSDAGGEVALHIDAEAAVPPNRAEMSVTLTGTGATKEEALSDLRAKQASLTKSLSGAGLTSTSIKSLDPVKSNDITDEAVVDEVVVSADDAAAEAAVAATCKDKGTKLVNIKPAPSDVKRLSCKPSMPKVAYEAVSLITVSDLAQLEKVQAATAETGVPTYRSYSGTHYFTADPAAANKAAREQAIAKARSEADGYAAALGYHVVRVTHVSNASPPFNMRDLQKIASYADMSRNTLQPSFFASAAYATVGIDFVIAPN